MTCSSFFGLDTGQSHGLVGLVSYNVARFLMKFEFFVPCFFKLQETTLKIKSTSTNEDNHKKIKKISKSEDELKDKDNFK